VVEVYCAAAAVLLFCCSAVLLSCCPAVLLSCPGIQDRDLDQDMTEQFPFFFLAPAILSTLQVIVCLSPIRLDSSLQLQLSARIKGAKDDVSAAGSP